MSQEKFYIPNLSEFYYGFLFEFFNSKEHLYFSVFEENTWNTIEMGNGLLFDLSNVHRLLLDKQIRVKYLDREDIESCGWKYGGTNKIRNWYDGNEAWFNNTVPTSVSGRYFSIQLIHDSHYNGIIIKATTNSGAQAECFFEGTIKNKSELQKLMSQLNIK